ncbi:MAG: hypothetical protein IJ325_03935 [Clostridia bacterium]|nr:hypothetical protein [Clostridia bacterium]
MFRFIHGYIKEQFTGLLKHGMFDETSGLKLHQIRHTPDELRFNVLARKDGELYSLVHENRRLFYVDRLQGGWWFLRYPYDRALIETYREMLGENFLGFQMHEWASNMANDWRRIASSQPKGNGKYTLDEIEANTRFADHNGNLNIFLESASAEEYAAMTCPSTQAEELAQYDWLYHDRMAKTGNLLLPCDSFYLYPRKEIAAGTKAFMPEVGAQIFHERMQIALTRGMARAYGCRWGVYYEPWGGDYVSCSYYKRDLVNEWGLRVHESAHWKGCTFTPDSGSSRELQKRICFHALFSGADFLSEEHGNANTFYDWHDYELSPYGKVKKDFLDFAADHRELGDVFVPAVIVIPKEFEIFDLLYMDSGTEYLQRPVDPALAALFGTMRKVLIEIFGTGKALHGNEGHCICNSRFGDIFDIVYDDVPVSAFERYDLVLDLSGRMGQLSGKTVLDGRNEAGFREMEQRLACHMPGGLQISGAVSWTLDRYQNGYILAIFNNEGILRSRAKGTEYLSGCDAEVTIAVNGYAPVPVMGEDPVMEDGKYHLTVKPGDVVVYKLKP